MAKIISTLDYQSPSPGPKPKPYEPPKVVIKTVPLLVPGPPGPGLSGPLEKPLDFEGQPAEEIKYATYAGEYQVGDVSGSVTVDFANGQKQRMRLVGGVTALDFSFPGVASGFVLFIEQDGVGGHSVAFANGVSKQASAGSIVLSSAPNSVTMMMVHWDGNSATVATIPNLQINPTIVLV